jgi:uncharacterized protein (TIGR02231 family)
MAGTNVIELAAPVVEVTLLEDRAHVIRRGRADLPAGIVRVTVSDVSPILSDKTLTARLDGPAKVNDVRVVRYAKSLREQLPGEIQVLEEALEKARHEAEKSSGDLERIEGRLKGLDRLEALTLQETCVDAAWDRDARGPARDLLGRLDEQAATLQAESAALVLRVEQQNRVVADLERRLAQARSPSTRNGARLLADLDAGAGGPCEIQFDYIVPGACWRPWHTARLVTGAKPAVHFRSEGCVWQNTGEDWKGVTIHFSTQRPSLGTEPPVLESDVLLAQKKAAVVQVAAREQEIQTTGLGSEGGGEADEMPGIDDGGDILTLRSTDPADVPSDGLPYRVAYGSFTAEAEAARVLLPELAPCAFFKTVQPNAGACPVLAGPVDLLRDGGFVGRTRAKYVAPGERFPIGWGPEGSLRVRRETDRDDEEAGVLSGWRTSHHRVTLRLSNIGAEALAVKVTERVPVSEIEQVEIRPDPKETTGGRTPDKDGFVTWDVQFSPYAQETLKLRYAVKKRKDVQGL